MMDNKQIVLTTTIILFIFGLIGTVEGTIYGEDPAVDPVFEEVKPFDGQGIAEDSARDFYYEYTVFSNLPENCKVEINVSNYTDMELGASLYHYQEIKPCKDFNSSKTATSLWNSIGKKKGDYFVNFTLSRNTGSGYVLEDSIAHNFRIGNSVDVFAGYTGLDYDLFRIVLGTFLTFLLSGAILKGTESQMVGGITLIISVVIFLYLGWFPSFYIFLLIAMIGIASYFIR